MKISGFTFVRNAVVFSYPLIESLSSLLPLCDEVIIVAGKSDDNTFEVLKSIQHPKIKIFETEWDMNLKKGGIIYSQQTNLALEKCKGDWCIYLQADEVLHEKDYDLILNDIQYINKNPDIDGMLFRYKHFYGSYDYIGVGRQWYRREIRAFRNSGNIISWGDAQGFRKEVGGKYEKLKAIQSEAEVFHYGWVRPPKAQSKKIRITGNYYHEHVNNNIDEIGETEFDYSSAYELTKFNGTHPAIMKSKIEADKIWTSKFQANKLKNRPFLYKLTDGIEKMTGYRIGEFKDFIEVKM
jgi:glycosyltransferase involved in cell wall biosynthesis